MKAILLNGSHANDSTGERVRAALTAQLETQGWDCDRARDLRNVCATGGIRVGGFAGIGWRSNAQWRTIRIRQSLELAAEALAQGQPIPQAARDIMAKPVIPHWVY